MSNPLQPNGILQRPRNTFLPGYIFKILWTPSARQDQVRHLPLREYQWKNFRSRFLPAGSEPSRWASTGYPLLTARFPRGTGVCRYRCFLPDLTGFAVPPCTGPNYQQSTSRSLRRRIDSSSSTSLKLQETSETFWRRGRDSNPRYPY